MATIKSYTDLEQSKVLAKILPLESADMWWAERYTGRVENYKYIVGEKPVYYLSLIKPSEGNCSQDVIKDIPCWSLTALLSVLPKIVNTQTLFIETSAALWHIGYRDVYIARSENLVDACANMILKLHELKML